MSDGVTLLYDLSTKILPVTSSQYKYIGEKLRGVRLRFKHLELTFQPAAVVFSGALEVAVHLLHVVHQVRKM